MNLPDKNSDYLAEWREHALGILNKNPDYLCITHIISLLCTTASFEEANRWKGLLLDAHRRKRLPSKSVKPAAFTLINEKRNKNLISRFKADEQYQLNSFWEWFFQDHDSLYYNDEFAWQLLQFYRDDIKSFIQSCYQWPLPETVPLKKWFKEHETDKKNTSLQHRREQVLKRVLEKAGIPKEKWLCMPNTLDKKSIYKECIKHKEFKTANNPDIEIAEDTFFKGEKSFWNRQKICKFKDNNKK